MTSKQIRTMHRSVPQAHVIDGTPTIRNYVSFYYQNNEDLHFIMLSRDEEIALFKRARVGDEEAREFLIKNHLLFVATEARRLAKGLLSDDEVVSAANHALMQCIDKHDYTLGFRFTSYLRVYLKGAIAQIWRDHSPVKYPRQIPVKTIDNPKALEPDFVDHAYEEAEEKEVVFRALDEARDELNEREKAIVQRYWEAGETFEEIGKKLVPAITGERVRVLHGKALSKLRFALKRRNVRNPL